MQFYLIIGFLDTFTRLVQMRKKYGQFFGLWMTSFNYRIVLSDPEYTEKILTSNVHLGKGSVYSTFEPLLGNGLVNSESRYQMTSHKWWEILIFILVFKKKKLILVKEWKRNRKILSQSFHVQLLKEFAKTFNNVSNVFIENMKERSFKGEIDLYQLATSYTLDSICGMIIIQLYSLIRLQCGSSFRNNDGCINKCPKRWK